MDDGGDGGLRVTTGRSPPSRRSAALRAACDTGEDGRRMGMMLMMEVGYRTGDNNMSASRESRRTREEDQG